MDRIAAEAAGEGGSRAYPKYIPASIVKYTWIAREGQ
jgi:hypothetical protein